MTANLTFHLQARQSLLSGLQAGNFGLAALGRSALRKNALAGLAAATAAAWLQH
jgi:hypothetical protein